MDIKDYTDIELEEEIKKRKESKIINRPKIREDIDFSGVIKMCEAILNQIERNGYKDEDSDVYVYEGVMTAIYGNTIWKYINSKIG